MIDNYEAKLEAFARILEGQSLERLRLDKLDCMANVAQCKTRFTVASKYARVDIGTSGRYMVVNETGEIFGIKGYGVIHRGHKFGTLDTLGEWFWGGYRAIRKPVPA